MTELETVYRKVCELLTKGSLAKSSCKARAMMDFLRPSIEAGVVVERRSNGGRQFVVENPKKFQERLNAAFPNFELSPDAPSRVLGVALYRDSKALKADTPDILTLRSWSESAFRKGQWLPTVASTSSYGVFSVVLTKNCGYTLHGRWALVEGPVMFLNFERVGYDCPAVMYGSGRISGRVLDWLSNQVAEDFHLVHFPDYDPVGLCEFLRLKRALGSRVSLYTPNELGERFKQSSKRSLLFSPESQRVRHRIDG